MSSKETLRITNLYSCNCNITFFSFRIMSKSVSLKIFRLKLVKLDCTIIQFDLYTIKKSRHELDGACGLPLVYY